LLTMRFQQGRGRRGSNCHISTLARMGTLGLAALVLLCAAVQTSTAAPKKKLNVLVRAHLNTKRTHSPLQRCWLSTISRDRVADLCPDAVLRGR